MRSIQNQQSAEQMRARQASGFTIIELMVAVAIGAFVLLGLVNFASTASRDQSELTGAARQLDNAQYAFELLRSDIEHAGFYGTFHPVPDSTGTPVDPCSLTAAVMLNGLSKPIEVFADTTGWTSACIPDENHAPGTDIVVIRRANSNLTWSWPIGQASTALDLGLHNADTSELFYLQGNIQQGLIARSTTTSAGNEAIFNIIGAPKILTGQLFPDTAGTIPASIRRFQTVMYMVDCSSDGTTDCTGMAQQDFPSPTMKRLTLTGKCVAGALCINTGGTPAGTGNPGWVVEAVAEGIEDFEISVGLDSDNDGIVDAYNAAPTNNQMGEIITARIWLLARNANTSLGQNQKPLAQRKTFNVGPGGAFTPPVGDGFKRNLYSTTVQVTNSRMRRGAS